MMRYGRLYLLLALALPTLPVGAGEDVKVPLRSGTYFFEHRYAEHPDMRSFLLMVTIKGNEISIVKPSSAPPFPQGEIARGTLFWHAASEQWIIVTHDEERTATEVGGCSDGPEVVDLKKRIYWTC